MKELKFSQALEAYLDHREQKPRDEEFGYTDKAFWRERQRLEGELDKFVKPRDAGT